MTGKQGFTLVEVLIAAVILAAGMAAVLQGFSVAMDGLNSTRELMAVSDCFDDTLVEMELSSWPKREPAMRDGGTWVTPAGRLDWQLHSDALMSTTNATLYHVVLEAMPVARQGRYVVDTAWLNMRERR